MRVYPAKDLFKHGPKFRVLTEDEVSRIKFVARKAEWSHDRNIVLLDATEYLIAAMAEEIHFLQEQLR